MAKDKVPVHNSAGEHFESQGEAARVYGVTFAAIHMALKRKGKCGGVWWAVEGEPIVTKARKKCQHKIIKRCYPIRHIASGKRYESAAEAAAAHGIKTKTVYNDVGRVTCAPRFEYIIESPW